MGDTAGVEGEFYFGKARGGWYSGGMSTLATAEMPASLVDAWRKLPEQHRASLLDYATFLTHEEERLIEESEAKWDERFNDPEKMKKFREWAEKEAFVGESMPLKFPLP